MVAISNSSSIDGDDSFDPHPLKLLTYPERVKKLAALTGWEVENRDYPSAIESLNTSFSLGIDRPNVEALGLVFEALSETKRFRGDPHIDQQKAENSATHCIQATNLMHRVFEQAGVIVNNLLVSPQAECVYALAMKSILIHDCGEILGEFSSVYKRATNPSIKEDPLSERKIFQFAFELAAWAVETKQPDKFRDIIAQARAEVDIEGKGTGRKAPLDQILADYRREFTVSAQSKSMAATWLNFFDLSEIKDPAVASPQEIFAGYLVKAVEHVQGQLHLTRFVEKDPTIINFTVDGEQVANGSDSKHPVIKSSLAQSGAVTGSFRYVQGELGKLFALARQTADGSVESDESARLKMALSRAVRDLAYQSCADYALVCPDFVNLGARAIRIDLERVLSDDSKSVEVRRVKAEEVLEQAQYHQRIAQKFLRRSAEAQEQGLDMSKILLKYESKERLQRVLLRAIEIDYIPEEKEIVPLSKSFIKRLAQGDEF